MAKESGAGRNGLSALARPFTIDRSSSLKVDFHDAAASHSLSGHDVGIYEYEPFPSDGFLWDDYGFDYSFLSSDDHMSVGEDLFSCKDNDMKIDRKGKAVSESSKPCGLVDHAAKTKGITMDFDIMEKTNAEPVSDSLRLYLSDGPGDSQKQHSVALPEISTSHFDSDVTLEERSTAHVSPTSVLGNSGVSSLVNFDSSGSASGIGASFEKKLADPSGDGNNENPIANEVLSPLVSFKPKLRIVCPGGSNNKSDLRGADASVNDKYSIPSDQSDSDVDSPCWKGIRSYKSAGGALQVSLSAPEGIGATPEVALPVPQVAIASSEVAVSALNLVTAPRPATMEHSNNELNGRHGLNPLAPHFVPANARQNIEMPGKECDGVGSSALQETRFTTVALSSGSYSYPTKAPEVPLATMVDNHISTEFQEPTLLSMTQNMDTNAGLASKVSSSKVTSLHQSGNDFRISKRLNPTARQFVPFNAKQTASDHEKEVGGGNLIGVQTITSSTDSLTEGNLQSSALTIQPSNRVHVQQIECVLPNKSCRSSKLKTSFTEQTPLLDNYLLPNSRLLSKPSASYSVKDPAASQPSLSYGLPENATASSSWRIGSSSDLSHQVQNCPSSSKLDVKKLLVTMHELSELLIHVHECSYDHDYEQEHALVENILQNLNLCIGNGARRFRSSDSSLPHASFKSEQKVNASKLSIRDLQIKKQNETAVKHDLEMKNCSLVLNDKGSPSGFLQENYRTGEELNPQALFYRSLWLKAEAARCSAEFEACLSNIKK